MVSLSYQSCRAGFGLLLTVGVITLATQRRRLLGGIVTFQAGSGRKIDLGQFRGPGRIRFIIRPSEDFTAV